MNVRRFATKLAIRMAAKYDKYQVEKIGPI
jgi:hypothetical protein